MKKILLVVLLLCSNLYAISGFTYWWNVNVSKDTVTAVKLKNNYDSIKNWATRISDTLNRAVVHFNPGSLNKTNVVKYVNIDTIRSNPNIDSISGSPYINAITTDTIGVSGGLYTARLHTPSAGITAANIDTSKTRHATADSATIPVLKGHTTKRDSTTFTGGIRGVRLSITEILNLPTLTASRAVISDGSKNIVSSAVTSTELGYLSGVTSAVQTQLDGKLIKTYQHLISASSVESQLYRLLCTIQLSTVEQYRYWEIKWIRVFYQTQHVANFNIHIENHYPGTKISCDGYGYGNLLYYYIDTSTKRLFLYAKRSTGNGSGQDYITVTNSNVHDAVTFNTVVPEINDPGNLTEVQSALFVDGAGLRLSNLTGDRALISTSGKHIISSTTTSDELALLSGKNSVIDGSGTAGNLALFSGENRIGNGPAYNTGSFPCTLKTSDVTVQQIGTAYWTKIGNVFTCSFPYLSGTSNSTLLRMYCSIPYKPKQMSGSSNVDNRAIPAVDNGSSIVCFVDVFQVSGFIAFRNSGGIFTNSGIKSVLPFSVTYITED